MSKAINDLQKSTGISRREFLSATAGISLIGFLFSQRKALLSAMSHLLKGSIDTESVDKALLKLGQDNGLDISPNIEGVKRRSHVIEATNLVITLNSNQSATDALGQSRLRKILGSI